MIKNIKIKSNRKHIIVKTIAVMILLAITLGLMIACTTEATFETDPQRYVIFYDNFGHEFKIDEGKSKIYSIDYSEEEFFFTYKIFNAYTDEVISETITSIYNTGKNLTLCNTEDCYEEKTTEIAITYNALKKPEASDEIYTYTFHTILYLKMHAKEDNRITPDIVLDPSTAYEYEDGVRYVFADSYVESEWSSYQEYALSLLPAAKIYIEGEEVSLDSSYVEKIFVSSKYPYDTGRIIDTGYVQVFLESGTYMITYQINPKLYTTENLEDYLSAYLTVEIVFE